MTEHTCLACHAADNLVPLYSERVPEAQPVAWVHMECLATETAGSDAVSEVDQSGLMNLLRTRPRLSVEARRELERTIREVVTKDD